MKPDYSRQIALSRKLQKQDVRLGNHRVFWVSYPNEDGLIIRETYRSSKQARERAIEIAETRAILRQ